MITSTANKQVKNIIQLTKKTKERQTQRVFLAEGIRIFEEIPKDWLQSIYVSDSFLQKKECPDKINGMEYETVSDEVFQRMADTKTPQGILCVVKQPQYELEELLRGDRTSLLILEGIQDPGNVGTIFRTAEGAGATGIIMSGCADLFAPKTVRSTMGSICRVPFVVVQNLRETLDVLKEKNVILYAAHLQGKKYYDEADYRKATAFLIGSEGNGLTEETAKQADVCLKIPMNGKLESLNAAMAAGILAYEVNRQR
ncbi:MAG: RNA methyltransferase, partial [Eubacterium sp.]|nr:RNA methyltransferase [Eubacterium sp.]